jgi:type II secretory ATPase GspE/PulE/Tfp pilus assembly ATPase PilB-like protein
VKTGELLLAHGLVTVDQLSEAVEMQASFKAKGIDRKIGDILVQDMHIINKERLIRMVAKQKDMLRVIPNISDTDMNLLFLFPKETLRTLNFVPYKIYQKDEQGGLTITVLFDENHGIRAENVRKEILSLHQAITKMKKADGGFPGTKNVVSERKIAEVFFSYSTKEEIAAFLEESFRNERVLRTAAERDISKQPHKKEFETRGNAFVIGKEYYSPDNENLNIFADILMRSIDLGASDLHIEPLSDRIRVRIRIDGMLQTVTELPVSMKDYFIRGLKNAFLFKNSYKSDVIFDDRKHIHYVDKDLQADLRFSIVPTMHGEKLVARILTQKETIPSLEELGFQPNIARKYELICSMASGIVIVT